MKHSNYMIQIPEPCHEDWNKMQADLSGRFCNSCSKTVIDFSNKSDTEIRNLLLKKKDERVCGHFRSSQVNRPLNIQLNLKHLPRNISSNRAFAIALLLVFGTFLFSCTDPQGRKIEAIEIINSIPEHKLPGEASLASPVVARQDTPVTTCTGKNVIDREIYISGGIRIEQVPVLDTITRELPAPENMLIPDSTNMVMGMMVMDEIPEPVDSLQSSKDAEKQDDTHNSFIMQSELSVSPNPGSGEFIIRYDVLKRADVRVDLFDMQGSFIRNLVTVSAQHTGKYNVPVNLSGLTNGVYIVNLINGSQRLTTRLVLEK